ncbi:hypothetical protein [Sphingorhabdus sp. SMR4y]|uniref:hypothetical protein n=1 Tax=Sphingorhabdus sp. SMR4y TaxID=2584094 RepID=UPI000B5C496C|nr:hypothetical protein [Sphingorhabdus sp. SMR4y]ASK88446.1 hypothetical protein SPHFLASMR4Y_01699 [Sphingorhabdus sp. SMR4y]
MTAEERIKKIQRDMLATSKLWGATCENAIRSGAWDEGSLIKNLKDAAKDWAFKHPVEVNPDD